MQYRANKEVINPRFLLYSFLSHDLQSQFRAHDGSGSVVSHIRVPDCLKFEINVPPLEKQNRIVDMLGSIDDKIELNRQTNQTLEQIAQAIFKSWFVDFEPVKAKIKAKKRWQALNQIIETSSPTCYAEEFETPDPNKTSLQEAMTQAAMATISGKTEEQLKDLDDDALQQLKTTAALFPDALVESELGEIPKGWDIKPLSKIAENHSTTFNFSKVEEVVFVNTGDVLEGRFLHKNYSRKEGLPGQAKKTIKKDDILYSEIRPKNKRFAYVVEDCDDYVVSTKFMIIRSLGFVHPRYLYQILRQATTIQEFNLMAESRSGTFPQITFDSVGYLPIVVPPEKVQNTFMVFFTPIIENIDSIYHEEKCLGNMRDALLPKLLSGEITLGDTQFTAEAVA